MTYRGRITARVPALYPALVGFQRGWTCDHSHRDHGVAFECAVKHAKRYALKTRRGEQSAAKTAGIRELVIGVTEVEQ